MVHSLATLERSSRRSLITAAVAVLVLIGVVDYLTGYELLFSIFYLLEVAWAAWFIGAGFGVVMSVLSVLVWIGGDMAAGARYSSPFVPIWNALILAVFYSIVVWLLTKLRSFQRDLEAKVRQRTEALEREMGERRRLEEQILQISEREQQRIGHDLHDGLCQHLTATALAGQVLTEQLQVKKLPETADASKIVEMVQQGIDLARDTARGLSPVEMEAEGLMTAFQQLAETISKGAKIRCVFECEAPVLVHDSAAAYHLYRIGQEAVRNALQHAKAKRIGINLSEKDKVVRLTVEDDGVGFPEAGPTPKGLGLRIMAHRAGVIGGQLAIEPAPTGGTMVTCSFPKKKVSSLTSHDQLT
jgi:signal transduction histidine kinase